MADPNPVYTGTFADTAVQTSRNYLIPASGVSNGDVLVLVGQYAATTTTTSKTAGPTGVTKKNANSDVLSGSSGAMFIYAGRINSSDQNTNITITTSTARKVAAIMMIFRDVDPDADLDGMGLEVAFATSGTAVTTPGSTTVRAGSIEVQVVGHSSAIAYTAPTSSWTKPAAVTTLLGQTGTAGSAGESIIAAGIITTPRAAGAPVGGTVWTAPTGNPWVAVTILLPALPTGIFHNAVIETTSVTATGGTVSAVLSDNNDATFASITSGGRLGLRYGAEKPALGSNPTAKFRMNKPAGTTTATVVATMWDGADRTTALAVSDVRTVTANAPAIEDITFTWSSAATDPIVAAKWATINITIDPTAT